MSWLATIYKIECRDDENSDGGVVLHDVSPGASTPAMVHYVRPAPPEFVPRSYL